MKLGYAPIMTIRHRLEFSLRTLCTIRAVSRALRRASSAIAGFALLLVFESPVAQGCVPREPTPPSSPGPHDYSFAPADNMLWREGDEGEPLSLRIRTVDPCGEPILGAQVQVLHADHQGYHDPNRWRATLTSNERGELALVTVLPGYAGGIPRHIHFIVSHPDFQELVTRLYFKSDEALGVNTDVLAIVLEEIQRKEKRAWAGGFEFVLRPR